MGRKNLLADLLDDKLTAVNEPPSGESSDNRRSSQPTLGSRGAVGAMSRSLEMLSAERDAAKALTEQLTTGQAVVEIDPGLIDASIVPDRMTGVDGSIPLSSNLFAPMDNWFRFSFARIRPVQDDFRSPMAIVASVRLPNLAIPRGR